ncbi:unnamed protein product, partial [Ectocarpus fasciculatus]
MTNWARKHRDSNSCPTCQMVGEVGEHSVASGRPEYQPRYISLVQQAMTDRWQKHKASCTRGAVLRTLAPVAAPLFLSRNRRVPQTGRPADAPTESGTHRNLNGVPNLYVWQ